MRLDTTKSGVWGGPFTLGLFMTALGIFAVIAAFPASLASVILFGAVLVVVGVIEIFHGVRSRGMPFRALLVLGGTFSTVVGGMMLLRPLVGLQALTLLLAGYFFANGVFRIVTSVADRYSGWGADLLYGIVAIVLGVIVMANWPISALWLVGTLVGVEIIMRGIALMSAGLLLRRSLHTVPV